MEVYGIVIFSLCVTFVVCEGADNNSGKELNQSSFTVDRSVPDFSITNIVSIIECVVGIIANGLLLFVIYKDPLEKLRKMSWFVIVNLAMADFITSVTSIAFCGNSEVIFKRNITAHLWALCILYIGYCSSFLLLLLFAIERYIAVSYPMTRNKYLSTNRTRISCLVCWSLAIVMSSLCWLNRSKNKVKIHITVMAILEIAVLIMIVIKILLIKAICTNQSHLMVISDQRRKQRQNMVITLVILIVVLITTALPYFVARQLQTLSYAYPTSLFPHSQLKLLRHFTTYYFPVACLNFIVNPFVYAWRLPDYRRGFLAMFGRKKKNAPAPTVLPCKHTSTVVETRC